jgi:hypothetical protein
MSHLRLLLGAVALGLGHAADVDLLDDIAPPIRVRAEIGGAVAALAEQFAARVVLHRAAFTAEKAIAG